MSLCWYRLFDLWTDLPFQTSFACPIATFYPTLIFSYLVSFPHQCSVIPMLSDLQVGHLDSQTFLPLRVTVILLAFLFLKTHCSLLPWAPNSHVTLSFSQELAYLFTDTLTVQILVYLLDQHGQLCVDSPRWSWENRS